MLRRLTLFIEYGDRIIDTFHVPKTPANTISVIEAFNEEKDANPKKVAFRDILLSMWKYKENRAVTDLKTITYVWVQEKSLTALLPQIYEKMGRNLQDDKDNLAKFSIKAAAFYGSGEHWSYSQLRDNTPFGAGAKKMLAEYSEFADRQLGDFEIVWTTNTKWNFVVSLYRPVYIFPPK